MNKFNLQQIQDIFAAAVALEGKERRDYLSGVETTSRKLYGEVVSLLSADSLVTFCRTASRILKI